MSEKKVYFTSSGILPNEDFEIAKIVARPLDNEKQVREFVRKVFAKELNVTVENGVDIRFVIKNDDIVATVALDLSETHTQRDFFFEKICNNIEETYNRDEIVYFSRLARDPDIEAYALPIIYITACFAIERNYTTGVALFDKSIRNYSRALDVYMEQVPHQGINMEKIPKDLLGYFDRDPELYTFNLQRFVNELKPHVTGVIESLI